MHRYLLIAALLFVPSISYATVTLSEIAWMGTVINANDEWIELHNSGSVSVDIEGWTLTNTEATILITLHGVVPSQGYALLERTDDETVPGVPALVTYVGALSNGGTTLILKRSDGSIEDQISGGTDWSSIGGDNVSKYTPQRTGNSWVTGVPTPGSVNVRESAPTDATNTIATTADTSTGSGSRGGGSSSSRKTVAEPKKNVASESVAPALTITGPELVYVHQSNEFEALSVGLEKTTSASLAFDWNFGDSNVGSGRKIAHTYAYPGEYVVVVRGAFAKHDLTARKTVRVLPITVAVTRTSEDDVRIVNTADHEIDISYFTLTGEKIFTFPQNSLLLPQGAVTIPKARMGTRTPVVLRDTERAILGSTVGSAVVSFAASLDGGGSLPLESSPRVLAYAVPSYTTPPSNNTVSKEVPIVAYEGDEGTTTITPSVQPTIPLYTNTAALSASQFGDDRSSKLPYLGLVGVMCVGVLALYLRKSP